MLQVIQQADIMILDIKTKIYLQTTFTQPFGLLHASMQACNGSNECMSAVWVHTDSHF